ncbi:MAG: hypothetical protein FJ030_15235 [Chloroflexi bacterium]|nr:hypothetical protein [Chloroflexota bacterium]
MPFSERHYRWEWQLASSPEALWPFVADSNRTNYDTHLPAVRRSERPKPARPGAKFLRFTRFGVPWSRSSGCGLIGSESRDDTSPARWPK